MEIIVNQDQMIYLGTMNIEQNSNTFNFTFNKINL